MQLPATIVVCLLAMLLWGCEPAEQTTTSGATPTVRWSTRNQQELPADARPGFHGITRSPWVDLAWDESGLLAWVDGQSVDQRHTSIPAILTELDHNEINCNMDAAIPADQLVAIATMLRLPGTRSIYFYCDSRDVHWDHPVKAPAKAIHVTVQMSEGGPRATIDGKEYGPAELTSHLHDRYRDVDMNPAGDLVRHDAFTLEMPADLRWEQLFLIHHAINRAGFANIDWTLSPD